MAEKELTTEEKNTLIEKYPEIDIFADRIKLTMAKGIEEAGRDMKMFMGVVYSYNDVHDVLEPPVGFDPKGTTTIKQCWLNSIYYDPSRFSGTWNGRDYVVGDHVAVKTEHLKATINGVDLNADEIFSIYQMMQIK